MNTTSLTREESYRNGHLTHPAFVSIALLGLITFMGNFTQLQLSSALPQIVADFGIPTTVGQWMTSVFQLVMGIMVPLTAFLTKRFSTRQIVISSMVVFTLGSALAWLAPTFPLVLSGRILEAVGSGIMWPVLQITIFAIFPLNRRGFAMGTLGMALSVAPAVGPVLGGWQTDHFGWRSVFLLLFVLGILCLIAVVLWLRNFNDTDTSQQADFFSVGLSIIGFGGLLYGFTNIESYPLTAPVCWVPMLVGLVGIVWFVARQLRRDAPLLNLRVLANRNFRIGTIVASLSFFAFSSIIVFMPIYIQDLRGYSATMNGVIWLPGAIGMCIAQFCGGRLLDRYGARPVAICGSTLLLLGTFGMATLTLHSWIWLVSIYQFTRMLGMGCTLMPVTTWSLNCLEPSEVSAGSAVTNTCRQIAGAIGAPVLVVTMETLSRTRTHALQQSMDAASAATLGSMFGIHWILIISTLISACMVVVVIAGIHSSRSVRSR